MRYLVLITDNYPFSDGEYFADTELKIIHTHFEKIHVLCTGAAKNGTGRFIPQNAGIHAVPVKPAFRHFLQGLFLFSKDFVLSEYPFARKQAGAWPAFKIMYMDLVRSNALTGSIRQLIREQQLPVAETVFYSYWHDYKALTLAGLRSKNKAMNCVARAHGWDVFRKRQAIPYLPFKRFIIRHLNRTFSVSEAGLRELANYAEGNLINRIAVSRLGTIRTGAAEEKRKSPVLIVCSCSNLIPLKRVHLIIDSLSFIKDIPLKWVHFGHGPLFTALKSYAAKLPNNIEADFRGRLPNHAIQEFYAAFPVSLFISLSASEGLPVSMMEAMSYGIPVLSTDVGGVSEIVNPSNGFLTKPDAGAHEVASMIRSHLLSENPNRQLLSQNAEQTWKEHFDAGKNYGEFAAGLMRIRNT